MAEAVLMSHTRKHSLERGVLVDVSLVAKFVGIRLEVALTKELHRDFQDMMDVAAMLDHYRSALPDRSRWYKDKLVLPGQKGRDAVLKIVKDDSGLPCITIGRHEDFAFAP